MCKAALEFINMIIQAESDSQHRETPFQNPKTDALNRSMTFKPHEAKLLMSRLPESQPSFKLPYADQLKEMNQETTELAPDRWALMELINCFCYSQKQLRRFYDHNDRTWRVSDKLRHEVAFPLLYELCNQWQTKLAADTEKNSPALKNMNSLW